MGFCETIPGEILAVFVDPAYKRKAEALTDSAVDDASTGIDLIETIASSARTVTADAAYDTLAFYETAKLSRRNPRSSARDGTIRRISKIGRRRWKKEVGYHRQARVENAFFRYKSTLGDRLRSRTRAAQAVESVLACNVVLSKNPIDAVRRADSPLDARRVATFVTAESRCLARPVCRLFPTCCRSSSWPSRAGSTRSRVTSLTLSRKRIASAEGRSVLAGSGSPTPSAGAGPHRPRASGDGYAVTGTPGSRPRPSSAGIDR